MKNFDINLALAGEPVVTRDGRKVIELHCFGAEAIRYPVQYTMEDAYIYTATLDGLAETERATNRDLFMAPTTTIGWVNLYLDPYTEKRYIKATKIYETEEEALEKVAVDVIDTIKIEWED
jgi:hypothetical protein